MLRLTRLTGPGSRQLAVIRWFLLEGGRVWQRASCMSDIVDNQICPSVLVSWDGTW